MLASLDQRAASQGWISGSPLQAVLGSDHHWGLQVLHAGMALHNAQTLDREARVDLHIGSHLEVEQRSVFTVVERWLPATVLVGLCAGGSVGWTIDVPAGLCAGWHACWIIP